MRLPVLYTNSDCCSSENDLKGRQEENVSYILFSLNSLFLSSGVRMNSLTRNGVVLILGT